MKKNYLLLFISFLFFAQLVQAQCPTPSGMVGTPFTLSGSCFMNVQFAIPNSNVAIYNASGFVAQATASASGNAIIPYPCASNPITSIVSIQPSPLQICNTYVITSAASLPIKLISFNGTVTGNKTVVLKWVTSVELNNEKYEIQKSTDGVNFTTTGTLAAEVVGLGDKTYTYEDLTFQAGATAYYRLKEIDADGKGTYSKIIYISDKTSATSDYSLFPNPLTAGSNAIQIKGVAATDVNVNNVRIVDLMGRNIPYRITGANTLELSSEAPAGIYLVKVKDKTIKLIKQ